MTKIYVSHQEAKNLLPEVKKIILKLRKLQKAINLIETFELEYEKPYYEAISLDFDINKRFYKLNYLFFKHLESLHKKGVIVKDLDLGLVDFYSKRYGKEIYLCWKLGEKEIKFWHSTEEGYDERKPIDNLDKKTDQKI